MHSYLSGLNPFASAFEILLMLPDIILHVLLLKVCLVLFLNCGSRSRGLRVPNVHHIRASKHLKNNLLHQNQFIDKETQNYPFYECISSDALNFPCTIFQKFNSDFVVQGPWEKNKMNEVFAEMQLIKSQNKCIIFNLVGLFFQYIRVQINLSNYICFFV